MSILSQRILSDKKLIYDILDMPAPDRTENSPDEIFERAFNKYDSKGEITGLLEDAKSICFIINDRNRPTPTHLVMEFFIKRFAYMVDKINRIVIATGSHCEPTKEELKQILGNGYDMLKEKIHIHRSKDIDQHKFFGSTERGTPLYFDRAALGHDLVIVVNSVEPHYFAGFTGGRKSILPGISSYETIETNHSYSLDLMSKNLQLDGNPVHEDMEEACEMFFKDMGHLSIQLVQAPEVTLTDVIMGNIFTTFRDAVEASKKNFCIPIEKLYDIVITEVKDPMNKTLYQSQKALENGRLALKDGGILILVSSMHDGIGQEKFWGLLTMSDDVDEIIMKIDEGYELGFHKAAKIVQLVKRADIFVVSEMDPDLLCKGFLHPFPSLGNAVDMAVEKLGYSPDILLIPESASVPMYDGK